MILRPPSCGFQENDWVSGSVRPNREQAAVAEPFCGRRLDPLKRGF
jgi:hypothetical protein